MVRSYCRAAVVAASLVAAGLAAAPAAAAPVFFAGTGNWYEFVGFAGAPNDQRTWALADAAASASSHLGMAGHLATVTSAAEDAFLNSNFSIGGRFTGAWLGGHVDAAGQSSWSTGPESGLAFANGGTPLPGQYANFGGVEPNNAPSAIYMNIGGAHASGIATGQWADAANGVLSSGDPIIGYIVEYEAVSTPEAGALGLFGLALAALGIAARRRSQNGG